MDYLDELDDSAMAALMELGCETCSHVIVDNAGSTNKRTPPMRPHRRIPQTFLFRIGDLFGSAWEIADALQLPRLPIIKIGEGEESDERFCLLQQDALDTLEAWITTNKPSTKLLKFPLALAHKAVGQLPLLGRDPTLPQYMASSVQSHLDDYAVSGVPFFFYGTLANRANLSSLFDKPSSELSPLRPATLRDGKLRSWGKYYALLDAPGESVQGWMYTVSNTGEEEALRRYETDQYELVAASMIVDGKEIIGRTFRFAGCEDDLT